MLSGTGIITCETIVCMCLYHWNFVVKSKSENQHLESEFSMAGQKKTAALSNISNPYVGVRVWDVQNRERQV